MEKSLKSINSISLKDIDFNAFSDSSEWMGYTEMNKKFSRTLIEEAISLFDDFFKSKGGYVLVITALSFDDEREEDKEIIKNYGVLYNELKSKRLLLPMTDNYESYLYGESPLPANSVSFSFSCDDFKNLSRLIMCHAGVIGQVCFYVNPTFNIAIYPHDDVGFGCVALNSEKEICRDFLNYCAENENFDVFMNSDEGLTKLNGGN